MPILGKILSILQIAVGGCILCVSAYLIYLTGTPEIIQDPDASEVIKGLYTAAGIIGLPGILFAIGGVAMLCRRKWGWWFGLAVCFATVATLGFDAWDGRHHREVEDLCVLAAFVAMTIFFFLPGVRNYLVTNKAVPLKARSTESS